MAENPDTDVDLVDALGAAVEGATAGDWRAGRITQERGLLRVLLAPVDLMLEIRSSDAAARAYRRLGAYAFAYRSGGGPLPKPVQQHLDRCIPQLAAALQGHGFDLEQDVLQTPEARDVGFPTPYHRAHLYHQVALAPSLIEAYREQGHVLVRRAVDGNVIRAAVPMIHKALERNWPHHLPPVDERPDAYSQGFTQITGIGNKDPLVRLFSNMGRVLRMAADLMGVPSVRLFCEDWLIKEPGARITPWHQDAAVFPFDAQATITAWIPLRDINEGEGLLRFARGAQRLGLADIEGINDESEAGYAAIIEKHNLPIDELPPVFVGDVSFHDGTMIHGAFPNRGSEHRAILALHCFAAGATIKNEPTQEMRETLAGSAPNLRGGDEARCDAWPLVFGPEAAGPPRIALAGSDAQERRLRAIVLPAGQPHTLVIERGLLRVEPIDDGPTPTSYATSGLVEAHGHISYPHTKDDPVSELRWMNERRADYAQTGVTLIRDMGATDDAICRLLDTPGLPRVHPTGIMILRNRDWPFTETQPKDLVRACVERIEAGASWVKVFSDWTNDFQGHLDPGFSATDEVTYPLEVLRKAVAAVHERGGRVGAHCFAREGARVAIEAGVDTLEHGWGVDEELLELMLKHGTAWAPLAGIARTMWNSAEDLGHTDRQPWLRRAMSRMARMLPLAEERGVVLLAGTDQFPAVTVADEVAQLHALGVSKVGAVAAGSWSARGYLNELGLSSGAPADLVLYPRDPREDLTVLLEPELILIGGRRVEPTLAKVRPSFEPFSIPA